MVYRGRVYYSTEAQSFIWDRYQAGEAVSAIGSHFDRPSSSIHKILARTGGIRPQVKTRSSKHLSLAEREEISRDIVAGQSVRQMAKVLGRARSTYQPRDKRNRGLRKYRATAADRNAWANAERPKPCKLADKPELCDIIEIKLKRKWSPQQISGWLKEEYADYEHYQVSQETIYKTLFIQARGALKKELQDYLRSKRHIRRARVSTLKDDGLGGIPGAISIRERPAEVEDQAVPGHWEGDLIEGSNKSCIATLVERHS